MYMESENRMPKESTGNVVDGKIPLTIRLKLETWKALDAKARDGPGKSKLVQLMLEKYLDKIEFGLIERDSELPMRRPETPPGQSKRKNA
jgi:hypothetical protein